ncbi:hypothetical protein GF314_16930 [bacterium]|nr:hypothetical protein [bacterium]
MDARAALLEGLIDYAGLFPPAALDLPTALRRFDGHQRGQDAMRLGRFVLPAARLDDIRPWLAGPWLPERPLPLSVLAGLDDLATIAAHADEQPAVRIEALEVRAPVEGTDRWLDDLAGRLAVAGLADREVYVELPNGGDDEVLAALGRRQATPPARRLAGKLRCGGVTEDLVPAPERVAAVLASASTGRVPMKFTAGLHHPVRGMDHTGEIPMHGFLNVYGAALLAHAAGLGAEELLPVILETEPGAFRLDTGGFGWRDRAVDAVRIAELRSDFLAGYGSCSFDEPMTDLRSLALLT